LLGFENFLTWIIAGGVSGWLASLIVEGYGLGLLGNVVLGFLGAALASSGLWMWGVTVETTIGNVLAVTAGAVSLLLLAAVMRWVTRTRR